MKKEGVMFSKILVALDNSRYSDYGMEAALRVAVSRGSEVTGCHVYAAKLHEARFMDMEAGLPPQYQPEGILKRQREIHESLIEKGLGVISDSYIDRLESSARAKGFANIRRKSREGKNYVELVKEAMEGDYDLVVMGGLGMGEVELSLVGGVCERVARHISKDMLILKKQSFDGKIMVGIDGSPSSYAALMAAFELRRVFGGEIEAVAVFDPYFHQVAFKNIAGALSEEASQIFRFKEQEKLHDEIIDKGIAKIYQGHLDTAFRIASTRGVTLRTTLIAGKAFNELLKGSRECSFLMLGRFGLHKASLSQMGNTVENTYRQAPTNVFIAGGEYLPEESGKGSCVVMVWSDEAVARIKNIPEFVRGIAKKSIEDYASEKGIKEITASVVDEVKKRFGM